MNDGIMGKDFKILPDKLKEFFCDTMISDGYYTMTPALTYVVQRYETEHKTNLKSDGEIIQEFKPYQLPMIRYFIDIAWMKWHFYFGIKMVEIKKLNGID
ncbi:MAG: hypothetical protein GY853_06620 [PVC group bacterium]|nr:hypothetical protein [PVC group bacterium]